NINAAYFRDQSNDVLMQVYSLNHYAMAQREIALAISDPQETKGYATSVFGMLTVPVEGDDKSDNDAGRLGEVYTVLSEGDDKQYPIVDCARAILDGHIVLSRRLADAGHYPAIDVCASVSRCMSQVGQPPHLGAARQLKDFYSTYEKIKELIPLGGYSPGADP